MEVDKLIYRPHIDGLRALAVMMVFLFKLNPELFPGGYLGVDVFFVISGFVITQSLYKGYLQTGKIRIADFYIRRFKRLYPALVTMVMVVTSLYFFFGFMWDTNLFIKSGITTIFAVSNFYYLYQADNYFYQDLINPFIHTWSLGVEEQFYVIYPLLLLLVLYIVAKLRVNRIYLSLIFLFITVSLYAIFVASEGTIFGDFYFPTARFWELGAGVALFFFSLSYNTKMFSTFLAASGVSVLLYLQLFQRSVDSLQTETLATVLATSALIFAGLSHKNLIIRFFENVKVVFVGKISYSFYLWLLPVVYFSNLYLNTFWYYVVAVIVTPLLATASYNYIEKVFRYSKRFDGFLRKSLYAVPVLGAVAVLMLMFLGPGKVIKQINLSLNEVGAYAENVNLIESKYKLGKRIQPAFTLNGFDTATYCSDASEEFTLDENGFRNECFKKTEGGGGTLVYLAGDSHAAHFIPMLDTSEVVEDVYFSRFSRRAIANTDGQPLNTDGAIEEKRNELETLSKQYETVYYMTSLFLSPAQDQPETMKRNLETYIKELSPLSTMIFVAPTPVFQASPESCVILGTFCSIEKEKDQERRAVVLQILSDLANKNKSVYLYDPYEAICPDDACYIYEKENDFLRYIDDDHLSVEASKTLSPHFDRWFTKTFILEQG